MPVCRAPRRLSITQETYRSTPLQKSQIPRSARRGEIFVRREFNSVGMTKSFSGALRHAREKLARRARRPPRSTYCIVATLPDELRTRSRLIPATKASQRCARVLGKRRGGGVDVGQPAAARAMRCARRIWTTSGSCRGRSGVVALRGWIGGGWRRWRRAGRVRKSAPRMAPEPDLLARQEQVQCEQHDFLPRWPGIRGRRRCSARGHLTIGAALAGSRHWAISRAAYSPRSPRALKF